MKQTLIVDCFSRTVPGVYFGQPSNVRAAQNSNQFTFFPQIYTSRGML